MGGHVGGHQSGTVNYFCGQCINDKQITFCVLQIRDKLSLNHNQNNLVGFLVFPLQHPQISRDFDSFSKFLEKLETSF